VNAIAFSEPSGLVASGGRDTEIVIWDLVGDSAICRLTGHKGEVTCLSFLPCNADFLVSGSKDGVVKIWSIKLQLCVQTITEPRSEVWSIGFKGTDTLIVGSSDKVVYVYKVQSDLLIDSEGLTVVEFFGQLDRPEPADGRVDSIQVVGSCLFAQTDRRVVEMWRIVSDDDEKTKRMKRRIKRKSASSSEDEEKKFRASDEFVIASAIENPSVALRYVANARIRSMSVNPVISSGSIVQAALGLQDNSVELFKIDARGATAEESDEVSTSCFSIKESRSVKREGHRTSVSGLSVTSNGNRLVSVSAESVIVWNAISLAFQRSISSPSGEIVHACFVPNDSDRIVLFTRDSHCCVLDVNSGAVCGIPIRLWEDIESPPKKSKKNNGQNEIRCVYMYLWEGEVRFLIGEKDRRVLTVKLERASNEEFDFSVIASHEIPDEPVSLCISPKTGMYIAAGLMNGNVELIYADSGKHYMSLFSHKLAASAVAFSPDDQAVVSGSADKSIKIWSVKFGNVLKTIKAHDSAVTNLSFVPHSHLVFSTSRDGVLSLWDIDRFERVMSKVNHPSAEVLAVASSGDAGMVFTAGSDRAIRRITRGEDQMFIEEEAEKAMEIEIEGEAQRDDMLVAAPAATKSSIESVRLLERVVQMIEMDEDELGSPQAVLNKKRELVKFVCTELPMGDLQQVAVTLPTGHARQLLSILAEVMQKTITERKRFPLGFPVEQCVTAGLYLIQAQAKFLVGEPHSRPVLLKLKELFHFAVQHEIQHVGTAAASVRFL
jgi:U3 small nucleolar RNA-associated protein 12